MTASQKFVNATDFKAKCLALLDEVGEGGLEVVVTKRGQPVAVLSAAVEVAWPSPGDSWAGRGQISANLEDDKSAIWEVVSEHEQ